jgi:hypothetical protein
MIGDGRLLGEVSQPDMYCFRFHLSRVNLRLPLPCLEEEMSASLKRLSEAPKFLKMAQK